jgi:hypothetical protein
LSPYLADLLAILTQRAFRTQDREPREGFAQEEAFMLCPKRVTEKKLAANRENAKKSTGPRTDRGKNASRLNAIGLRLFAGHIFIPLIDFAEISDFRALVIKLCIELRPQSTLEEFYVVEIAKSMWKIRRAGLAEEGLTRKNVLWDNKAPNVEAIITDYRITLEILEAAEKEAIATGQLSASTYDAVVDVIRAEHPDFISQRQSVQNNVAESKETAESRVIVGDTFVSYLKDRQAEYNRRLETCLNMAEEWTDDYFLSRAVPGIEIMERIVRYETAARRNLERSYASLVDLQKRR